jgi:hypothetical protein
MACLSKRARQIYMLVAAKRQLKKSHLELNFGPSLRSRLDGESEEGFWNLETDSVISYQLLGQIEDSEGFTLTSSG